jgi:hypothetical protein
MVLMYCWNTDLQVNKRSDISAVVYHDRKWHRLGHSTTRNCPTLGLQFPEAGIYDIIDNLPDYQPPNTLILDLGDLMLVLPDPNTELAPQAQLANIQATKE